jgi:hypothetical protein
LSFVSDQILPLGLFHIESFVSSTEALTDYASYKGNIQLVCIYVTKIHWSGHFGRSIKGFWFHEGDLAKIYIGNPTIDGLILEAVFVFKFNQ